MTYFFYEVLRPLEIERNVAMGNQVLKTSFEPGDILRSEKSLPSYLLVSRKAHLPFLEALSQESDTYFDVDLPEVCYQVEFK